jgi:signal recognition particle receptor subunit beta
LRHHALSTITQPQNLKGIIFVVDSASIASEEGAQEAAEYLHNLLLLLQKRITGIKSSKAPTELPVLIAANKLDLFTALPATLVKATLEKEITDVRKSRAKGLLDSGIGMGESELPEERDWLGDGGEGKFSFAQMAEVNVDVAVIGGSLQGADSVDVQKWWDWIGNRL